MKYWDAVNKKVVTEKPEPVETKQEKPESADEPEPEKKEKKTRKDSGKE